MSQKRGSEHRDLPLGSLELELDVIGQRFAVVRGVQGKNQRVGNQDRCRVGTALEP